MKMMVDMANTEKGDERRKQGGGGGTGASGGGAGAGGSGGGGGAGAGDGGDETIFVVGNIYDVVSSLTPTPPIITSTTITSKPQP
ncbi:hypothetical protein RIF29_28685 [Crotalaria pallida]|uniref:Uncharacterized protein n=1 Tax=Crotalaria pallida TaxID=3830 RepID=A0AAN9HT68_CROPI